MTLLAAKVDLKAHQWLLEWERWELCIGCLLTFWLLLGSFLGPANEGAVYPQLVWCLLLTPYGRPHLLGQILILYI